MIRVFFIFISIVSSQSYAQNQLTLLYQNKVAQQKKTIKRSGLFRKKDSTQNKVYQSCKDLVKILEKNQESESKLRKFMRDFPLPFMTIRSDFVSANKEDWWLYYNENALRQMQGQQQVNFDDILNQFQSILSHKQDLICLPFNQSGSTKNPAEIVRLNWHEPKKDMEAFDKEKIYKSLFDRNKKLLTEGVRFKEELPYCEFQTPDTYVPMGAKIIIYLRVFGNADAVTLNGEPVSPFGAEFVSTISDDKNFVATVSAAGVQKTCHLNVSVVRDKLKEDMAFCNKGMGRGRRLLVIYPNELSEHEIKKDMDEVEAKTGIKSTLVRLNHHISPDILHGGYDGIWIISDSTQMLQPGFISTLKEYHDRGVGLGIFADNDPFYADANHMLKTMFPDWNIIFQGNYMGTQMINRYDDPSAGTGKFFVHPVTSGLYASISEGITTANIVPCNFERKSISDRAVFHQIIQNSEGNTLAAGLEEVLNDQRGAYPRAFYSDREEAFVRRTFLHGAYTSLMQTDTTWGWNSSVSPGTPQFFANVACWTTGAR